MKLRITLVGPVRRYTENEAADPILKAVGGNKLPNTGYSTGPMRPAVMADYVDVSIMLSIQHFGLGELVSMGHPGG